MNFKSMTAAAPLAVLALCIAGCGKETEAAKTPEPPTVEVATVEQRDVPIYSEWIGTMDGYVNADIKAQVSGYLLKQDYVGIGAMNALRRKAYGAWHRRLTSGRKGMGAMADDWSVAARRTRRSGLFRRWSVQRQRGQAEYDPRLVRDARRADSHI